jgi:hypothetical protein
MPRENGELITGSPYAQYERVEVTFPSTANIDTVVRHSLLPQSPTDVEYHIVGKDRAGEVYHDYSATRKPWSQGYIVLRSSVASMKATLLLTVPRTE